MASYEFICPFGHTLLAMASIEQGPPQEVLCPSCADRGSDIAMARDYAAENVGVAVAELKRDREARGDEARILLPTNEEFASAKDPEGTKGMRAWREAHEPKTVNKRPKWPGEVEKKVM